MLDNQVSMKKFRHYEKATKYEKNLPPDLTKQLFLLSSVKTGGRFFQIFVAFSEKLDFKGVQLFGMFSKSSTSIQELCVKYALGFTHSNLKSWKPNKKDETKMIS